MHYDAVKPVMSRCLSIPGQKARSTIRCIKTLKLCSQTKMVPVSESTERHKVH